MIDTLSRLKSLTKPIRVAIVGTGSAGTGLAYQCNVTPGMECVVISDLDVTKAKDCAALMNREYRTVDTLDALHDSVREGMLAVCEDGEIYMEDVQYDANQPAMSLYLKAVEQSKAIASKLAGTTAAA